MSVLILSVALVAGPACSKSKKPAATKAPEPTTTTIPPVFPLTGLPATGAARENITRPALVIKIGNHPEERPQSGLEVADLVFNEVVEGGQTRYLAVFHSTDADPVGPVRSVRPSDPDIVAPLRPLFGYSGGTPKFIDLLRKTPGITDVGVDKVPEDVYPRRPGRRMPHNQYSSTQKLYSHGPDDNRPPPKFAEFRAPGEPFAGAGAVPAAHLALSVGSSTKVDYNWDAASGTYKRTLDGVPHNVESGAQLAPANVIVQFVPYVPTGDTDVTKAPVSKANVIGTGEAWIFSGGMLVKGKWSKSSISAVTTFTDVAGGPVRLAPGRTWIELPAVGAPATAS